MESKEETFEEKFKNFWYDKEPFGFDHPDTFVPINHLFAVADKQLAQFKKAENYPTALSYLTKIDNLEKQVASLTDQLQWSIKNEAKYKKEIELLTKCEFIELHPDSYCENSGLVNKCQGCLNKQALLDKEREE